MPYNEAPLSVNFKPHGGYDAPLITVRAESPEELAGKLNALASSDVFDAVGRAQGVLQAKFELGKQLGATTEAPHMQPTTPQPEWSQPQQAPQPSADPSQWGQQQHNQPPQQYQQPPAQAPTAPQPPAQPTHGGNYGAPQQSGAVPGAPLILGMPAKLIDKGKWKAWADPRPMNVTDNIHEKTADPNDPGLAAGSKKFWAFIK